MEFDQTFTTNGLWGDDEGVRFWGETAKVTVESYMSQNALFSFVVCFTLAEA